jgi:hypothetical protein
VLDLHPQHHSDFAAESLLEAMLSIAASVLESLHRQHATIECVIGRETYFIGPAIGDLKQCLDALSRIPSTGLAFDSPEVWRGLAKKRRRALAEYVLTTSWGLSGLRSQCLENTRFVVLNLPANRSTVLEEALGHLRPWLETPADAELLETLPRQWRRACCVG